MKSRVVTCLAAFGAGAALLMVAVVPRLIAGRSAGASALPASGMYLAIDCDPTTPGIQDTCSYPATTTNVDVDLVLHNVDVANGSVAAFDFHVVADQSVLAPKPNALPANPELNAALPGTWNCASPERSPDLDPDPGVAESFLSCFDPIGNGAPILAGSSVKIATVHYAAAEGTTALMLSAASVADANADVHVSCDFWPDTCRSALVTIGSSLGTSTATSTPTVTPIPTATPTQCLGGGPCATPSGVPTGAVSDVLALNSSTCITLGVGLGGLHVLEAYVDCTNISMQQRPTGSLRRMVLCLRGDDFNGDGVHDCLTDNGEPLHVVPGDFAAIDRDRDQVHAGQQLYVLGFVDGDYPVAFSTDAGDFVDSSGNGKGNAYTCFSGDVEVAPFTGDPDCDGNPLTVADGVVVARLRVGLDTPRGAGHVTVTQGATSKVLDFEIVGPPVAIALQTLGGKTSITTGATVPGTSNHGPPPPILPTDCLWSPEALTGLLDRPERAAVLAKALDSDGHEVAGALMDWTHPLDPAFGDISPQGGVALPETPTMDLGDDGIGLPQVVCGGKVPGVFSTDASLDNIIDPLANTDAHATYEIDVVLPPTVTPTPSPTATPTATGTPTPADTPSPTDTPTAPPLTSTAVIAKTAAATTSAVAQGTVTATTRTAVPTATDTPVASSTPEETATPTDTSTPTETATDTPTPTATDTPVPTDTSVTLRTHTPSPSATGIAKTSTPQSPLPAVTRTPGNDVLGVVATPRPQGIVLPQTGSGTAGGHQRAGLASLAAAIFLVVTLAGTTRALRRR